MKISVNLDLDERIPVILIKEAVKNGYLREYPNRRWTDNERKQAVRYGIKHLINNLILHPSLPIKPTP